MDEPMHDDTKKPPVFGETLTPEQETALEQSIAHGEAQFQAGEGIDGEGVFTWMRSWRTDNELPAPTRTTHQA
jgi:predicted transcriptional regulator